MISLNKSILGDMALYYELKCDLEEGENLRCEYMSFKSLKICTDICTKCIKVIRE